MILYHAVTFVLSLLATPVLLCFARGRERAAERFGSWSFADRVIWFHGASAGELQGLLPIIKEVRASRPGLGVLVTATSPTGLPLLEEIADYTRLIPYDSYPWICRALGRSEIVTLVSAETEIWPGIFSYLHAKRVPIFMVNARVTPRSVRHFRILKSLIARALSSVEMICAQTRSDEARFVALGARPERVRVTGNTKYERSPTVRDSRDAAALRRLVFTGDDPVVTLGSIRPGEEGVWFPAIARAIREKLHVCVVVAPRHKEQFDFFVRALEQHGIPCDRWSVLEHEGQGSAKSVVVLDTFGRLEQWYSFTALAHVGGTCAPYGGHNPLEASHYGCALVAGSYVDNIKDIVGELRARSAILDVLDSEAAFVLLRRVAQRDSALAEMGSRGKEFVASLAGVTRRVADEILRAHNGAVGGDI